MDFSDHDPFLTTINTNEIRRVDKKFKFESAWLLKEGYEDMVKSAWNHNVSFEINLDQLKNQIEMWKML